MHSHSHAPHSDPLVVLALHVLTLTERLNIMSDNLNALTAKVGDLAAVADTAIAEINLLKASIPPVPGEDVDAAIPAVTSAIQDVIDRLKAAIEPAPAPTV
jgi:hypothetical protein